MCVHIYEIKLQILKKCLSLGTSLVVQWLRLTF